MKLKKRKAYRNNTNRWLLYRQQQKPRNRISSKNEDKIIGKVELLLPEKLSHKKNKDIFRQTEIQNLQSTDTSNRISKEYTLGRNLS